MKETSRFYSSLGLLTVLNAVIKPLWIFGIDHSVLWGLLEEVPWVSHQILIDRIVSGQQHCQAFVVPSPATTGVSSPEGPRKVNQRRASRSTSGSIS